MCGVLRAAQVPSEAFEHEAFPFPRTPPGRRPFPEGRRPEGAAPHIFAVKAKPVLRGKQAVAAFFAEVADDVLNKRLQEKYYDGESIRKWLLLLEQLEGMYAVRSSLTDQSGLHMMTWVMDNPVPKDWGEFIEWVKAYDSEREMVD